MAKDGEKFLTIRQLVRTIDWFEKKNLSSDDFVEWLRYINDPHSEKNESGPSTANNEKEPD